MKRIGLLTMHYVDNYGAVLQAYALKKVLNNMDCTVEIINYFPPDFCFFSYEETHKGMKRFVKKRKKFEDFLKNYCDMHLDEREDKVKGNDFDLYLVGSDQVWNPCQDNAQYVFPDLEDDARKVSYAASIGMSIENFKREGDFFLENIKRFEKVSLREDTYLNYFFEQGINCRCVADPTFLLERENYDELLKHNTYEEDYILFFWLQHVDYKHLLKGVEFVNRLSRKYGLPIVHSIPGAPSYMFNREKKCMFYCDPIEFLSYVKNAKFMVTNSYHGTLFAMQFHVPFYTFQVEIMRCRIDYLAKTYRIKDRVVEGYKIYGEINDFVDFDRIDELRKRLKNESINYIHECLELAR